MELTSITMDRKTPLVAFTLMDAIGEAHQYTLKRNPGESLADCCIRVEEWMRQLKQGGVKPLNSAP